MVKQPAKPGSGVPERSPDMDRQINGMLQAMYGAVENEPIPERFLELLEKLDAAESAQSAKQTR